MKFFLFFALFSIVAQAAQTKTDCPAINQSRVKIAKEIPASVRTTRTAQAQ